MKKIKICVLIFTITVSVLFSGNTSFAEEITNDDSTVSVVSSTEDPALIGATIISNESYLEGRKHVTKTVYEQPDGTIIVDTLTVGTNLLRSAKGTDTATRTRTIDNFATISITATFSWYTEGRFSYVKCTSMNAPKPSNADVVCDKWEKSWTTDYVSVGKAKAQVSYKFHRKDVPARYTEGTFKITCTDDGTISDND